MKARRKKKKGEEFPFSYPFDYRYELIKKIEPELVTVWRVEIENLSYFCFWHKNATLEDLHRHFKILFPGTMFKISSISNGEIVIDREQYGKSRINNLYLSDGRRVDQDWKVKI